MGPYRGLLDLRILIRWIFFWGFLKENVYREPVVDPENVIADIHAAVTFVDENMLMRVRASMLNRANVCLEVGGNLFEHLL